MKIGGVQVKPALEILVLPRIDGDLVIKAKSVAIKDEFDVLCPVPTPPTVLTKNGKKSDLEDKSFLEQCSVRDSRQWDYMILRSLEPSNIEWERVDLDKPSTWSEWRRELVEAGLSEVEVNRVTMAVMSANSLDEEKIKAARESFLLGQEA